jgi:anaerobic magnesium-protoporphyrin IX monomethyl ester cyclase
MTDCLLVGFNDFDFPTYVDFVRLMGVDSGAYQDLKLAFIEHEGKPYRALDILSLLHDGAAPERTSPRFHNSDFLWPVITYLGTYLDRQGFSFDYVNLFHLEKDKLREKLEDGCLTVAITTTLYVSAEPILEIIAFIREFNSDAKVVVGGPYISNQAKMMEAADLEVLLDYLGADLYVIGREGELTLARLLAALKTGGDLAGVPNLAYRSAGRFRFTEPELESNSLAENLVDYSLFPAGEFNDFVTTRTAKSCPFSCAFCGFPQRAGRYTYLGVGEVELELDHIRSIGSVSTITFIDDTFNVPKKRFREILRMMIRNEYDFKWNSFYRSDHGDNETIALMKEAGCEGVFLGIESGSDAMLERMNKTARREDYMEALGAFAAAGIETYASLIIGFPGETDETIAETIDLLEQGKPDFFRAQLWYCDPITPIWERRDEFGISGTAFNWTHDTMDWRTACDHINRMFTGVRNSVWLPQFGFEQWSTFYLQRKGMSMAQIKTFLRCFNAIVAEQIDDPTAVTVAPGRLEQLRASSQFESIAPAGRGEHADAHALDGDAVRR